MKKTRVITIAMCIFSLLAAIPVYAQQTKPRNPSEAAMSEAELNGYSEEQWSMLKDNRLEYGEIKELVHSFNPTMSGYWESFDDGMRSVEYSIDVMKEAKKSAEDTFDLYKSNPYLSAEDRANLMMLVAMTSSALTQYNDTYRSLKKSSAARQIAMGEDQYVRAVQKMMIGYKTMESNVRILKKLVELNEASLKAYRDMQDKGMATETEVLKAQAELISARSSLAGLEAAAKQLYAQLITMCGWKADDAVVIGDIPEADEAQIAAMDPAADFARAAGNNTTLISLRQQGRNKHEGALKAQDDYYTFMEDSLRIRLDTLYAAVIGAQYEYEGARAGCEGAGISREAMKKQHDSGMLSDAQYIGSQIQLLRKEAALETARNNLRQAAEDYEWAVRGYCDIN